MLMLLSLCTALVGAESGAKRCGAWVLEWGGGQDGALCHSWRQKVKGGGGGCSDLSYRRVEGGGASGVLIPGTTVEEETGQSGGGVTEDQGWKSLGIFTFGNFGNMSP